MPCIICFVVCTWWEDKGYNAEDGIWVKKFIFPQTPAQVNLSIKYCSSKIMLNWYTDYTVWCYLENILGGKSKLSLKSSHKSLGESPWLWMLTIFLTFLTFLYSWDQALSGPNVEYSKYVVMQRSACPCLTFFLLFWNFARSKWSIIFLLSGHESSQVFRESNIKEVKCHNNEL